MMIPTLLSILSFAPHLSRDTDFIDQLNGYATSNVLVILAILTSFKMFGGKPVECMVPDEFSDAEEQVLLSEQYAENYCWSQDTYFLPFDEQVPQDLADREDRQISYYQWVPFFLLIEAAMFRLPSLVWKYLAGHSGIKIHDIVKLALDEKNVEPDMRKANIRALTIHLQNALRFHRRLDKKKAKPHRLMRPLNLPYTAIFVTTMYLITKVLYLVNVCLQLWLLNKFLETDKYSMYGWGAMRDILNGTQWEHTGVFPRVTLCDFQVRVMGNIQRYSVQCVLVINIFNEKIFIFLWFWYIILLFLTVASLVYWFLICLLPFTSRWFIVRHLELSELTFDPVQQHKEVERFVGSYFQPDLGANLPGLETLVLTNNNITELGDIDPLHKFPKLQYLSYLKKDGIFVLRMITMHAGIIFGTDLVSNLWMSFYGIEQTAKRSESQIHPGLNPSVSVPSAGTENRFNFLRNRFQPNDKKEKDKILHSDSDDDDLSRKLIAPASAPSAPPKTLDYPDSKVSTLEATKLVHSADNNNQPTQERRPSKGLKIRIPSTDRDYRTARDRSPRTPISPANHFSSI